jgi:LytS/YehU family sensor histidine kinase
VKEIRLSHDQNIFSFYFTAIDFINPEDNHQYYMLENYDAGWNRAGPDRRAFYFKVPPGKYIFRVKAANSNGLWAEKSIAVIISPPWWANWWIRIASVIGVVALIYGLVRRRLHQKFRLQLERSQKENQLVELKNKAAELEMEVLRSQMNPHFIFNSLTSINRFILQNNRAQASEYLTKFSKLMRLILQNSQASLITLESELKSLELYLDLEALRFDHHFTYNISVQKDLDIDTLKVPPLIIQPYAENAIWHGLMHKEEKGYLDIKVSKENNYLYFKITDDGIGREQAATFASKSATRHKSMGLKITASRLAMLQLQHSNTKVPPVTINDLVNTDGTAAGTEVIIKIPV